MIRTFWRVHPAGESPSTVLDVSRRDGWVASDESAETQPRGVSACLTLDDLRTYRDMYLMAVRPGDVVLELRGRICGADRDQHAERVEVMEIVAVHAASILNEDDE